MARQVFLAIVIGLLVVGTVAAQVQPDQPVAPQAPTLEARPAPQQPPPAPFTLSHEEDMQLDGVLRAWHQRSIQVKTFRCSFTRYEYDKVFGPTDNPTGKPKNIDVGEIAFGAPDKGMYSVKDPRPEHWICDGRAIFEYDYTKRQVIEHKLPPELQGQAIANGPLPFLFGSPAEQLKRRYYLRLITPQEAVGKEIWLQAYPRFQQDAANFRCAELILLRANLDPVALQLHLPGGNQRHSYVFEGVVVNDPLGWLKGDPFRAFTPLGWQKLVEQPPQVSSRQQAVGGRQ